MEGVGLGGGYADGFAFGFLKWEKGGEWALQNHG